MDAERATDDLKKVEYMQDKIGQKYPGIISGVMANGIFVELENTIEGLVRVSSLDDDYYMYIEKHHCLMGKRTRKIYRLGDKVSIKVSAADMQNRRLDFVLDKEKSVKNNKDTNKDRKDNQGKKDFKRFKKVGQHAARRKGNSSKQKSKA
ncbi:Ribonuclease R [bioreactor metagenome]|uniref:Ribonuclease R n=1 Tax=bioreactor metagenome TaxID=1076179 RepID=A0A645J105_9ZZZZ